MTSFLRSRLGVMMFLQYVIWGSWYVTINTYLTSTLHFSGTQAGAVFGTVSVASLVSPFFVGLVADRFFATERVMTVLYALSAVCIYLVTRVDTFPAVYSLMLLFCLWERSDGSRSTSSSGSWEWKRARHRSCSPP